MATYKPSKPEPRARRHPDRIDRLSDPLLKDSKAQRQTMVDCQIRTFDVTDRRIIERFEEVPREVFLPEEQKGLAYSDIGFRIGASGRYLLPPLILGRLLQGARIRSTDRVLDVACGFGYSTAIIAGLAKSVVALEALPDLVAGIIASLPQLGLATVEVVEAPLGDGVPTKGPFDVIIINGAVEGHLDGLLAQLAEGGRLATIRRSPEDPTGRAAKAICYEKRGADIGTRYLFDASAPVLDAFRRAPEFVF